MNLLVLENSKRTLGRDGARRLWLDFHLAEIAKWNGVGPRLTWQGMGSVSFRPAVSGLGIYHDRIIAVFAVAWGLGRSHRSVWNDDMGLRATRLDDWVADSVR
jgi:hypothetical protein